MPKAPAARRARAVAPSVAEDRLEAPAVESALSLRRGTIVAGLLREATDEAKGSTQAGRLKAWELLAKLGGFLGPDKAEDGQVRVHFDIHLDGAPEDGQDADGHVG